MLSKITGIMSDLHINIRDLLNKSKGDFAVTIMDIDDEITMDAVQYALGMPGIIKIRVI
jgi:D-3-phosphoglycerate dehydrogenase